MRLTASLRLTMAAAAAMVFAAPALAQTAPPAFNSCRACHSVDKGGKNGIGPNLNGIVGRNAASMPGFNYSSALKNARLSWDDRSLDTFLAAPAKKVPGTRMPIGTPDPAKRAAIIAYLKTLK
ncbi:MAG: cytochrome c [Novosphingobium lindaniclasticum]|uniref:c-type cytochrome n=1 Tax=Novosphingobium lindaniclasticum TaxID=1329895 RepID=UPI002409F4E3|nr:cytochrome c family protein [Novosphingobium lindaniclasticum]MDF2638739.1 cytochrome c [Novosphingobium lindaniclasticum]